MRRFLFFTSYESGKSYRELARLAGEQENLKVVVLGPESGASLTQSSQAHHSSYSAIFITGQGSHCSPSTLHSLCSFFYKSDLQQRELDDSWLFLFLVMLVKKL